MKKRKYIKKAYESTGSPSDVFAGLYKTMLVSPAWRALTPKQQQLYVYCKLQAYDEKRKPIQGDPDSFTMNQYKWSTIYQLYTRNNAKGFYRDMEALIDHGFVKCVFSGKLTREKSVYAFSSKWHSYGTPKFEITPSEMTYSMQRKLGKAHLKNV